MENERVPVKVRYVGSATYSELAPMLDELQSRFWSVNAEVETVRGKPKGAGGVPITLEIIFELGQVVGTIYLYKFIEKLAGNQFDALWKKIAAVRSKKMEKPGTYTSEFNFPLSFVIGTLAFYVDGPLSEEELLTAVKAAAALARTLPEGQICDPQGVRNRPLNWDRSSKSWKGPLLFSCSGRA